MDDLIPRNKKWGYVELSRRVWDLHGPIFTGSLGWVLAKSSIVYCREIKNSLFNPRVFESTLGQYLTDLYGDAQYDGAQIWLAPCAWAPDFSGDVFSATFNILPAIDKNEESFLLALPLSDAHFLVLRFTQNWSVYHDTDDKPTLGKRDWLDRANVTDLLQSICNGVEVKLSVEAMNQKNRALAELGDSVLSENLSLIHI